MGREKGLIWLLRFMAGILLLALPAAMLPFDWMDAIHQQLQLGRLPAIPIVEYLARSASLLYASYGALLLFLSLDVRRYRPVIRFKALLGLAFGAAMLAIDLDAAMPLQWATREGPFIIFSSAVILWLAREPVS